MPSLLVLLICKWRQVAQPGAGPTELWAFVPPLLAPGGGGGGCQYLSGTRGWSSALTTLHSSPPKLSSPSGLLASNPQPDHSAPWKIHLGAWRGGTCPKS